MNHVFARFIVPLMFVVIAGCGGGNTDPAPVVNAAPTLLSLAVTPVDPTIAIGLSQQFVATGTYSDGSTADVTSAAKWTSGGSTVSILFTSGLATGKAVGIESIKATVGTISAATRLTVRAPFAAVSAGGYHTVALKADGSLFAWGRNLAGQLGDGTNTDRSLPTQVGTVKTWAKISAGERHTVAIRADGTLWAWGFNQFGQLGDGTNISKTTPTKVGTGTNWVAVSAGKTHTTAIKKDGTLWAWGSNAFGQLGIGSVAPTNLPVQTGVVKNYFTNWTAVSAGDKHTLGQRADGTIWSWGDNTNGQLGLGSLTDATTLTSALSPQAVVTDASNRWVSVSAGGGHSLAIRSDGALFAWGANGDSQLGIENISFGDIGTPTQVGEDTHWAFATASGQYNLALKTDGSLWGWGANNQGQLGDGTTIPKSPPVWIGVDTNWLTISLGPEHAFAFKSDGTLWGWGRNLEGQQGNGTVTNPPVVVPANLP